MGDAEGRCQVHGRPLPPAPHLPLRKKDSARGIGWLADTLGRLLGLHPREAGDCHGFGDARRVVIYAILALEGAVRQHCIARIGDSMTTKSQQYEKITG